MSSKHFSFHLADQSWYNLSNRPGEVKIWEKMHFGSPGVQHQFVILGISEDFGPQLNGGFGGSDKGFQAVIEKLGHQQDNRFCTGSDICVLGEIRQNHSFQSDLKNTDVLHELDELVVQVLNQHLHSDSTLIAIGGGHNNAYPIIKYFSEKLKQPISAINIDPHADCRSMEFRHSGNGFSFAIQNQFLSHYHVLGLHEAYNNEFIYDFLSTHSLTYQTFESFIDDREAFLRDFTSAFEKINGNMGLEVDMDAIKNMPSSAQTPSGFTLEEVRFFIRTIARRKKPRYLHLPESAPKNKEDEFLVGKALAYMISDFIKCSGKLPLNSYVQS